MKGPAPVQVKMTFLFGGRIQVERGFDASGVIHFLERAGLVRIQLGGFPG
jgi:hypothetical protein